MSKDATTRTPSSRSGRETASNAPREGRIEAFHFLEIRPGLFVNVAQMVSVRVLQHEEGTVYAILQLSNGDKLNLTKGEFSTITGEEPRPPTRLPQHPPNE